MKRGVILGLLSLFAICSMSSADMIEVKNEGILNGRILSRNDKEVKFKDAKGKERVIPRKDVLYMDADISAEKPLSERVKTKAKELWTEAKKAPAAIKKGSDALTEKFIGEVGKPLDRSAADAKGAQLAGALDQATTASGASINKTKIFNNEVIRQQSEAKENASRRNDSSTGHFTSL